ncbi:ISKra4 family transposase [Lichenicola cladoniae]|uniref:ISKra4 family transposase n=1 Tax=Lichenicola cladoniae TaxID=1484109 RepID=A0A6M8HH66_9PROT|nr:ISKra4 family transposase [Lichenicola cladoniae]NPD70206.1 ISKra4 family transposase [Acetobacteraceae bacterium]QKE88639.1 ISKra4 family transposase [Lichenicola cladoniae]
MNDWDFVDISWSPLTELLPDRCTPELGRLQAELSARHPFREAARLLTSLLPCQPMNHATMRNRTHRVASDLEQMPPGQPAPEPEAKPQGEIMVLIDGAHIRAAHGYQSRRVDVTVGNIEVAGRPPRRFALAPKGAGSPLATMRQALREQGWQPGRSVTVLSDGEAALPGLVRAAVGEPIACILDWWHISMRVQHIQQAMRGIHAPDPQPCLDLDMIDWWVGRLQKLIWHDRSDEALDELFYIQHAVPVVVRVNGETLRSAAAMLLWNCDDLRRDLENAGSSLINYGERYRSKLPISTSRAEGCFDEIANARMAKKQRMRWSPARCTWRRRGARRGPGRSSHAAIQSSSGGVTKTFPLPQRCKRLRPEFRAIRLAHVAFIQKLFSNIDRLTYSNYAFQIPANDCSATPVSLCMRLRAGLSSTTLVALHIARLVTPSRANICSRDIWTDHRGRDPRCGCMSRADCTRV